MNYFDNEQLDKIMNLDLLEIGIQKQKVPLLTKQTYDSDTKCPLYFQILGWFCHSKNPYFKYWANFGAQIEVIFIC